VRAEELDERRDSFLVRHLRYIRCRFDAQDRYVLLDKILQEVAIVAGHLDH
jgi:hypothetical protein